MILIMISTQPKRRQNIVDKLTFLFIMHIFIHLLMILFVFFFGSKMPEMSHSYKFQKHYQSIKYSIYHQYQQQEQLNFMIDQHQTSISFIIALIIMINVGAKHKNIHLYDSFAVGATSGFVASFLTAPTEYVSKILHPEKSHVHHHSSFQSVFQTLNKKIKEHGFRYFHQKEGLFAPRLVLVAGLNFSLKEHFKSKQLKRRGKNIEFIEFIFINFLSGAGAGLISEILSYPLKNMEVEFLNLKRGVPSFADFKSFLSIRLAERGIGHFYNGLIISTFYQVLYRALYFGIYDSLRLYLMPKKSYKFHLCFPSGYIAAFMSSTLCYPLHKILLKMSQQRQKGIYRLIELALEGSLTGLWKGWRINFLGSVRGALVLTFNDGISFYSHKKHLLQ